MRKILIIMMFTMSAVIFAEYHRSTIGQINFHGEEWGNSHSGGVLFNMDTMPDGISFFRIKSNDIALRNLISVLLLGYSSDFEIVVFYDPVNTENKYCTISAIRLPKK